MQGREPGTVMAYRRCTSCGVVSDAPVPQPDAACPECSLRWPPRPEEVIGSAGPERRLGALVRMTRDLLEADVAMLTEISDTHEHARLAAGEWPELGSLQGRSLRLDDTFCRLMLEGKIPHAVPDAPADPRVADLPIVSHFHVHAYLGVPISPTDAELYVLCCLAREARPSLGARELSLLSGLAASVRAELQSA